MFGHCETRLGRTAQHIVNLGLAKQRSAESPGIQQPGLGYDCGLAGDRYLGWLFAGALYLAEPPTRRESDFFLAEELEETPVYIDGLVWDVTAIHTAYPEFLTTSIRML